MICMLGSSYKSHRGVLEIEKDHYRIKSVTKNVESLQNQSINASSGQNKWLNIDLKNDSVYGELCSIPAVNLPVHECEEGS